MGFAELIEYALKAKAWIFIKNLEEGSTWINLGYIEPEKEITMRKHKWHGLTWWTRGCH